MKKITPDKLVALILEEIKKPKAPDHPIYFETLDDVYQYYGFDENMEQSHESEMAEMANVRDAFKNIQRLAEPLYIPVNQVSEFHGDFPNPVRCLDPRTNQIVENVIIGDLILPLPNGQEMLAFQNYAPGIDPNADKTTMDQRSNLGTHNRPKKQHFLVLPENAFYHFEPRNKRYNSEYIPRDLTIEPEGETPEEKEARLIQLAQDNENYAKRYIIFPAVNELMSRKEILDRLDVSLIPETWANMFRTERTTNVETRLKFGGNGTDIQAEFYAVRDFDDVETTDEQGNKVVISGIENAMNDIIKTRMDIEDGIENRERKMSQTKPREYANYIYTRGGNWEAMQRIYDESQFKAQGEYTKKLKLLRKNILKGKKGANIFSKLTIHGELEGNTYVLQAKFQAELFYRTVGIQTASKGGQIIEPIRAEVRKNVTDEQIQQQSFTIKRNRNFFGTGKAKTTGPPEIFTGLMDKLGEKMLNEINPDEVLTKISQLLVPANLDKEFNTEF
jgi:hypothetical protein